MLFHLRKGHKQLFFFFIHVKWCWQSHISFADPFFFYGFRGCGNKASRIFYIIQDANRTSVGDPNTFNLDRILKFTPIWIRIRDFSHGFIINFEINVKNIFFFSISLRYLHTVYPLKNIIKKPEKRWHMKFWITVTCNKVSFLGQPSLFPLLLVVLIRIHITE